jgi:hypothetical protein
MLPVPAIQGIVKLGDPVDFRANKLARRAGDLGPKAQLRNARRNRGSVRALSGYRAQWTTEVCESDWLAARLAKPAVCCQPDVSDGCIRPVSRALVLGKKHYFERLNHRSRAMPWKYFTLIIAGD